VNKADQTEERKGAAVDSSRGGRGEDREKERGEEIEIEIDR
jgi:hypothetical protein